MDFDELIISIVGAWGKDCIECADTLNRYYTEKEKTPKCITVCTGIVDVQSKYDNHDEMLNGLKNHVIRICFSDLECLVNLFNSINIDNPHFIIDCVWKECNSIFKYWGDWFDKYKERLYDLL